MTDISNQALQIIHESNEEGYRITVIHMDTGAMLLTWLMSTEDATRFAEQIQNTLAGL